MIEQLSRTVRPQPLGTARHNDLSPPDIGGLADTPDDVEPFSAAATAAPVAVFDNFWAPTLCFAVSLGKRGVPLHFYGRGAGGWSRFCARRAPCPPVDDTSQFLPWLREKVRSGEIARVAPTTDLIAYYISVLRDDFAPEVRRTIAPLQEMETHLIKTRFTAACQRLGQATPLTGSLDPLVPPGEEMAAVLDDAAQIGFPLMLKPNSHLAVGSGERGAIVRNSDELRAVYHRYAVQTGQESIAERHPEILWPLLQKYIPSARTRVFSVSGYKDPDAGIVAASLSCKQQQWPPDTGISTAQVSCHDERILSTGLAAVDGLLSRGIFELELLAHGSELLAIDLNPRAFGFIALDVALGNDLPWLWFQSTVRPLAPRPIRMMRPIMASRLTIPYFIGRAVRAMAGASEPVDAKAEQSVQTPDRFVPMLGCWSDPLPLLLSTLKLLRHPGGLIRPYLRATAPQQSTQ